MVNFATIRSTFHVCWSRADFSGAMLIPFHSLVGCNAALAPYAATAAALYAALCRGYIRKWYSSCTATNIHPCDHVRDRKCSTRTEPTNYRGETPRGARRLRGGGGDGRAI